MLYKSNATERRKTVCGQEESHSINQEQLAGECQNMQLETTTTYQNKEIHVVLEFPEQSDPSAEDEFISRLKEIYLRKIEIGARQEKESALESNPNIDSDMKIHKLFYGSSNTKEDKNHE